MAEALRTFFVDYGLPITYGLLGLAVVGVVLFPLIQAIFNPRMLVKTLIGVGVLAVVYFVGMQMSSGPISDAFYPLVDKFPDLTKSEAESVAQSVTNNVSAGLFMTYVLGGVAIVGIFFTEIAKFFR